MRKARKRSELLPEMGSSLMEKNGSWNHNSDDDTDEKRENLSVWNWNGEGKNIALLFFLYLLQGIPLGLIASIPLMLQNRHVSYKEQAEFSVVFFPFSLKILWAPIVDSLYFKRMGRRKTWVFIPFLHIFCIHRYTLMLTYIYIYTFYFSACPCAISPWILDAVPVHTSG
jgi:hypothetical protein